MIIIAPRIFELKFYMKMDKMKKTKCIKNKERPPPSKLDLNNMTVN